MSCRWASALRSRGRRASHRPSVPSQPMRSVLDMVEAVVENLRSAVYASHQELSAQVQADSALDAKFLGLLGFFAVGGSVLLTLPHGLRDGRALLLVGIGFGVCACLVGTIGGSSPSMGPPPEQ